MKHFSLTYPAKDIKVLTVLTLVFDVKLKLSAHARQRMALRCITKEQIRAAIQKGSKHIQKPDKIVAEYRYVSVVYIVHQDCIYVITVQIR